MPHEDDEGSLWADQLNNDSSAFPVFVYLTNGENTGYCTNNTPIEYAPSGTLGTDDLPPFNWAGDLAGAPAGFAGAGPPPQYDGAQGYDPPVFPQDPNLNPALGWAPLLQAASYTGADQAGTSYTEAFDGPCRAGRLAATTMMLAQENAAVANLSPTSNHAYFPSVTPGQAPSGQVCFSASEGEVYRSGAGAYAIPGRGGWTSGTVPAGNTSAKDPCAYYWLTPTGDLVVFDQGDGSLGYRAACPPDMGGRLTSGGTWPNETMGYGSIGAFPAGATTGRGCPGDLPDGQEAYTGSASDATWVLQQILASGLLPPALPVAAINGAGYLDGFNPAPAAVGPAADPSATAAPVEGSGSIDVDSNAPSTSCYYLTAGGSSCAGTSPAGACEHYLHPNHLSVGLALLWNRALPPLDQFDSVCSGDPAAAATFGTRNPSDGSDFFAAVFENDGTGTGSEGAYQAYAWDTGLSPFDPYGPVTDTCPGSAAVSSFGQWQYACQEAVTETGGPGAPTPPGDLVRGMRNAYRGAGGEGFTYPV